jgi:hypothetical protein
MMDKKRTCGDTVSFYHLQQASKRTPISSLSGTHDPVSFFRAQSYVSIEMNTIAMNCQNSTLDPSQKYRRVGFTIRVPGYFSVRIVALRLFLDCDHLDWSLRLHEYLSTTGRGSQTCVTLAQSRKAQKGNLAEVFKPTIPPPRYHRWTLCRPRLSRKAIDLTTQPNSSLSQVYYRPPYFHLFGCCGSFGRRPSEVPQRQWEEKQAIEAKGDEWWRER